MWHWALEWLRYSSRHKAYRRETHVLAFIFMFLLLLLLFCFILSLNIVLFSVCRLLYDRLLIRCMHVNVCRQALVMLLHPLWHDHKHDRGITFKIRIWITYLIEYVRRHKTHFYGKKNDRRFSIDIFVSLSLCLLYLSISTKMRQMFASSRSLKWILLSVSCETENCLDILMI